MLYVLYGTDTKKSREKLKGLIGSLIKREPDAARIRLDSETTTADTLSEHTSSQGLFAKRAIVVLDRITESEEAEAVFDDRIKDIADSHNIFVLIDITVSAKLLKKLEKYAEKVQVFNEKEEKPEQEFNVFAVTDALGSRDKKLLWVAYQKALRAGVRPEEIHGTLFWQVKTMLLVEAGDTKDVKPYPAKKSAGFLKNFTHKELEKLSRNLVDVYTNDRQGRQPFALGLEKLILSM